MLEPLQKLVRLSPPIAESLACREIFNRTVQKLGHKDAVTRLNLLRILRTICDATEEGCTLIKTYHVYDTIIHLSNHDSAILVRQMAEELVHACDEVGKRSTSRAAGFRRPASSSGFSLPFHCYLRISATAILRQYDETRRMHFDELVLIAGSGHFLTAIKDNGIVPS